MNVEAIMTPDAQCVAPEDTLVAAAMLMRRLDVGAVPVCSEGRLAGILTDRDIALRAVAEGRDPKQTAVREAMTIGIVYVFDDDPTRHAAELMEQHQIRRLPVLNRDKRLVGMVSLGDIALHSEPALAAHALKEVSQPPLAAEA